MSGKRISRWLLPLLLMGGLLLLFLLNEYPVTGRREPALLEMSVIGRESEGSAWVNVRQGMEQAAADFNVELQFLNPGESNNPEEQCRLLRRESQGGAGAILLFPADREALAEEVRSASSQAALVTLETDMSGSGADGWVGTDNQALGEALGNAAFNGVRRGETVLLLDSAPEGSGIRERLEAAKALLLKEGRGVRICAMERKEDLQSFFSTEERLTPEGREIRAVAAFEASALEKAAEVLSLQKDAPLLYGIGATAMIAAGIEQGRITSVTAQNEFSIGYLAVETASRAARREPGKPLGELPLFTVRRENMYTPEYQKLLFPVSR